MIKAILFDFDGVLTLDKTGSQSIANYIISHSELTVDKFKEHYYKYNDGLLYGKYTHKDIWNDFCSDIELELDYNLLYESFIHTPLDKDMFLLIEELKKFYKIGMITDNKKDRMDAIIQHFDLASYFDVISISADYHSGKDKKEIFDGTVEKLKVTYSDCIFIDNTESNLFIPQMDGMKTILFDDENRNIALFKTKLTDLINKE